MIGRSTHRNQTAQFLVGAVTVAWLLIVAVSGYGQISPEEHAKHHPGQAAGGAMASESSGPAPGGMGCMESEGAGQRELYPSLMGMSEFTSEQRQQVQQQVNDRMREGLTVLSQGLEQLAEASQSDNLPAMQAAAETMRVGLTHLESGAATQRALADGKAPSEVALDWFKREMRLLPAPTLPASEGVLGISWFHFFLMAFLIVFAAVMIWMYFHKMQRAAVLLQGLTGAEVVMPQQRRRAPVASQAAVSGSLAAVQSVAVIPQPISGGVPSPPSKRWSGNLRVSAIFQETPDVKTFRLMNPLGGVMPFAYLPGQFLTVKVVHDGKPVKRSYTIASAPTQRDYVEITVKHEDEGVVSGVLHNQVREGDLLEFFGPSGSLIFTGRECKCILLIGAGVGITPLMSVLRYLIDRSWPGDIYLLYGCRTPQDIIFHEELDYLQHRHANLRVIITVSHPEGTAWTGKTGRISKELISQSVPDLASRYVHLCGPVSMMEAVKKILAELGVPGGRVKTEAFGLALGKPEPTRLPVAMPTGAGANDISAGIALPSLTFSLSDKVAPLPPDKAILDVADEIGVEIDNSCRVGTCGICRTKMLSGSVTMAVEDGLEPGDKESNIILACQAKSAGNVVVEA